MTQVVYVAYGDRPYYGWEENDPWFDGSEEDGIILAAGAQYARAVAALVVSCHLGGDAP